MKKSFTSIGTLVAIILLVSCNFKVEKQSDAGFGFSMLKERGEVLANAADWPGIKEKAMQLVENIKSDSSDLKSKLLLAQLYMQEARITGEHPYYYPATLRLLNNVLTHDSQNFEALAFKASVLLSLHHFSESLVVGNQAKAINDNNSFIYGVLCDANVELGNYEEAVKMSDKMQSIRPGLESYSRASYLREIYGDNAGAIEAMKLAFEAGLAGSEEASWAGNTLAQLYLNVGDYNHAEEVSKIILEQRPSYAFAINTLGEIDLARGDYAKAMASFDKAIQIMPEFSFYENKARLLELMGKIEESKSVYRNTITMLKEDASSGHYVDMDLAKIYLALNDSKQALKYARTEYQRRPMNIDVNQTMAWVQYKIGNQAEAKKYLKVAMRMGTKMPEFIENSGLVSQSKAVKHHSEKNLKS